MICCLVLAVAGTFLSGCKRVPENFPKVVPCQITVVKEDVPLPQVTVMLIAEGNKEWFVAADTNPQGIAEIQTFLGNFSHKGAPPGKYKVTLSQIPQIENELTQQQIFDMSPAEKNAEQARRNKRIAESRSFPIEFESAVTTPITVDVTEPKTEIHLNVSEWIGKK